MHGREGTVTCCVCFSPPILCCDCADANELIRLQMRRTNTTVVHKDCLILLRMVLLVRRIDVYLSNAFYCRALVSLV